MNLLEDECGTSLTQCVEAIELAAQSSRPSNTAAGCPPKFLGPDIGWSSQIFDPDRACREDMDKLETVCGDHYMQCLTFLDVLREGRNSDGEEHEQEERWSAEGTLTMSARSRVLTPGSEDAQIFISMLRNDISFAVGTSEDYVSIIHIEAATGVEDQQPPAAGDEQGETDTGFRGFT
jgi:hypothetical protein